MALRPGDRFVLRRGSAVRPVGGTVLDTEPARGISRRRQTPDRVARLVAEPGPGPLLELHGAEATGGRVDLASDVVESAAAAVVAAVGAAGIRVGPLRATTTTAIRRLVTLRRETAVVAADLVIDGLVADGRLSRDGDAIRPPGLAVAALDPALAAAMDRLEAALDVPAPPPLAVAARAAGCPPDGVRALERAERIAILEPDLAYAMATYLDLSTRAVTMAARQPLTPASYRDATGTSRKFVMAILEDLDRRAILRRTPAGHVPGPKAPRATSTTS